MRLPPDARSAGRARRMLQERAAEALAGAGPASDPDLVDTAVLLASELCENAVLHAGTEFERGRDRHRDRGHRGRHRPRRRPAGAAPGPAPAALRPRGQPRPRARAGAAAGDGVGHPPRGRRPARRSGSRSPAAPAAPTPAAPAGPAPDAGTGLDDRRAGPLAAAHAAGARRPAASPPSWSPSWSAGCASCWTPTSVSVEVDEGDGTGARELARDGGEPAVTGAAARGRGGRGAAADDRAAARRAARRARARAARPPTTRSAPATSPS